MMAAGYLIIYELLMAFRWLDLAAPFSGCRVALVLRHTSFSHYYGD